MSEELSPEQQRTAMKSPEHLKQWLEATGRRYLVLRTSDLVDALPWPDGHNALLQILAAYRSQRLAQPSGRTERGKDLAGRPIDLPVPKDENLEIEELDRCIRDLIGDASRRDPNWKLENAPL